MRPGGFALLLTVTLAGCGGASDKTHRRPSPPASAARPASAAPPQPAASSDGPLTLSVQPAVGLADLPRQITVSGLAPGSLVTVQARTQRANGYWVSSATFRGGADGKLNLGSTAPVSGDYARADAMGLFWAQRPVGGPAAPDPKRVSTTLTATAAGQPTATATAVQLERAPGLTERTLRPAADGLYADYFAPAAGGRHPGVVLWGGTEGGLDPTTGELIASHGIAVLDLAYLGEPGLPDTLSGIPIEYFIRAVRWLRGQRAVDPQRVWLLSWSRGTEAELLVAAHWPALVHGVVAESASAVAFGGWTLAGAPVPQGVLVSGATQTDPNGDVRQAPAEVAGLSDSAATEHALIPLGSFRGDFLLCVGDDDQLTASLAFAPLIMRELDRDRSPHVELSYPGAGHTIFRVPYTPPVIDDGKLDEGGTPAANSAAQERNWPAVLAFIKGNR